ncbi:Chromosome partition protein Smc [Candidatus Calditenuaceae archaeon HR02]|nr:Chromosome partition protein Smc [Candidatus Calditenuaceae archaeon HR02]
MYRILGYWLKYDTRSSRSVPGASKTPLIGALGAVLLVVAMALPAAYAQAYNITVEDTRIKVRLTYPPEVEIGSCFNIQIEVTALSALDDLNLTLKIIYFYDSQSQTLYNQVLIDDVNVLSPSVVLFKNIGLCIPAQVAADPWLEARLALNYHTVPDGLRIDLANTFYLSTVRQVSYNRLSARLAEANQEISRLRAEVSALKAKLEEAAEREEVLKARIEELTRIKEDLEKKLAELQTLKDGLEKQLSDLSTKYSQLLVDNSALQERYKTLMDNYAVLQKSYEELRRDYDAVSRDLASTRGLYNDLQSRHEALRTSYESSVKTLGQLEGSLRELERQREVMEAMLAQATGESGFFKNVAVGQGVGLVALGGGVAAWLLMKRRGKTAEAGGQSTTAPPSPTPPPSNPPAPTAANPEQPSAAERAAKEPIQPEEAPESEVVQKVISGRRVTIPSRLAERLGIGIGDSIKIGLLGDRLVLVPIRANGAAYQQPPEPASRPRHSSEIRDAHSHQDRARLLA